MQSCGRSGTILAVALLLAAPLASMSGTAVGGGIAVDPSDDFLPDCNLSATPRTGVAAMDLLGGRALGERDGFEVFELETAGDAGAYFSSEPPSASFVITVVPAPGGPRYELIREIHEGRRRSVVERDGEVVERDGEVVAGAELLVNRGGRGVPRFEVRGIPGLGAQTRWGVTSNVLPDENGPKLCDRYGLDTDGNPELSLPGDAPTVTTTTPPAATGTSAPRGQGDSAQDSNSWVWWLLGLFGLLGVAVLLWWLLTKKWSRWPVPGGGSHGAPDTPPPEGNDFGA